MERVFYEKLEDGTFEEVSRHNPDLLDAFPEGSHLIVNKPGSTLRKYDVDVAIAPFVAASMYMQDEMCNALVNASQLQPSKKPINEEVREAWSNILRLYGDEQFYAYYPSAREIAQAGAECMVEHASRLMDNPSVKSAYDDFLLVCKLALDK